MYAKFMLFTVIPVLLVPLGYSSFATNEACALATKMLGSERCTYNYLKTEKTCCYLVTSDIADGSLKPTQLAVKYCEDCKKNYKGEWVCEKPYRASEGSLPDDPQDSLDVKPTQPTEPKFPRGDVLPDDGEPTINDPPTTTEPKILDPGKIEIPNLK